MLDWLKRRGSAARDDRAVRAEAAPPTKRSMSGKYQRLQKYLEERYANTVVLTFAEIEDLLGFALPDQARNHQEWWTAAVDIHQPNHSDCWTLAKRTAKANLPAQTVAFERPS